MKIAGKGIAEGPYEEMGQGVAGKLAGYKYASELNDFYGAFMDWGKQFGILVQIMRTVAIFAQKVKQYLKLMELLKVGKKDSLEVLLV